MDDYILPKESGHINGAQSTAFKRSAELINAASSSFSLVSDFYIKTAGRANLHAIWHSLPLMDLPFFQTRTLCLTSVTSHYSDLWSESLPDSASEVTWLKDDPRLSNEFFRNLTPEWNRNCALRSDYERRQALVEIDVLVARELSLTLDELLAIYRIQFPVLRQNENDTWYDRNGRIVFTCSKGLTGVGLPRKKRPGDAADEISYGMCRSGQESRGILLGWEDVQGFAEGDWVSKTWMDDTLPGGPREKTVVYEAPFDRCDREEDYRVVWEQCNQR